MKQLTLLVLFISIGMNITFGQESKYKKFEKNTLEGTKAGIKEGSSGKEILPAIYDNVGDYAPIGGFPVLLNGKVGFVDTTNKPIFPVKYSDIWVYDDIFFIQDVNKKWALADKKGVIKTTFVYDDVSDYRDGVVTVIQKGKVGFIDNTGKQILPCKFTEGYAEGNFILVYEKSFESLGYEYVTKDANGNVVNRQDIGSGDKLPIVFNLKSQIVYKGEQYERVKFTSGKRVIIVEGRKGYHKIIDLAGKTLISYENMWKFSNNENWIRISNYDDEGILSQSGEIILKPNFKEITVYEFKDKELAKVFFKDDTFFYINKSGKCVDFDGVVCPQ